MNMNTKLIASSLLLALACACVGGCSSPLTMSEPGKQSGEPRKEGVKTAVAGAAPEVRTISGKVVETMAVGSYRYVCLEKNGNKFWAAIPLAKVELGSALDLRPGIVMHNFHSKSLNRTFDNIVFSDGPVTLAQAKSESGSRH